MRPEANTEICEARKTASDATGKNASIRAGSRRYSRKNAIRAQRASRPYKGVVNSERAARSKLLS